MSDERDPILDACLDEILGGQTPPDLKPRIMQALSLLPPALPTDTPVAPPVQNPVQIMASAKVSNSSRSAAPRVSRLVVSMVVAVSIVAIGLGIGFALRLERPPSPNPDVVQNPPTPTNDNRLDPPEVVPDQNTFVDRTQTPPRPHKVPEVVTPEFATDPPFATDQERRFEFAINSPQAVDALDDAQIVSAIDDAIRSAWNENKISPAPRDDDDGFARRLFQQLFGRGPTKAELQPFLASRSKDKRAELVDALLTREENVVEFARHWSDLWADVLVGRVGVSSENKTSREGLQQYLRRAIQQKKPMDEIATELLTATGSGAIGSPQYNGAANFMLAHYERKATRATSQVARAFLGKRIQCAQCHDHPGDSSLAQSRFWELNAFLRQLSVEPRDPDGDANGTLVLSNRDFHGDGSFEDADAEVIYETASGQIKVAYPALPGVTRVPRSGIVSEFDRRAGLARYVATSQDFRRAVVNRVWSNIFGYGFTSPVDDLGPHNPPSHPKLLNDLADQFAAHDHDLRSLIRWMVLSEPFQLGKGQLGDLADAPGFGGNRWFSRAYPAAVAQPAARESLLAMAKAVSSGKNDLGVGTTAIVKPSFPPGKNTSDGANSPTTIASSDVWQTGNVVPPMIERILDSSMPVEQKLEHLFLVTVQRSPTNPERGLVRDITGGMVKTDRKTLLRIWWTLEQSSEFGVAR